MSPLLIFPALLKLIAAGILNLTTTTTSASPTTVAVPASIATVTTAAPVTIELPAVDQAFLEDTNAVRPNDLQWSTELAAYAEWHLARIMVELRLWHSDLKASPLLADSGGNWKVVGENVGTGFTQDDIQTAYMNSPTHRENVEWPAYTHFGSASKRSPIDGRIWTVEIFGG